ncbi:hypothetical protein CDAR_498411 [Caerostris darwini]|uniref:Uncharacterized protein n=1 Tax=Caerostris darwini TaxID=1538125 RepID=A0AAV4PR32_9ARAC|nr:hypothetical protein CDAR_498411 [Caerostris darwini]
MPVLKMTVERKKEFFNDKRKEFLTTDGNFQKPILTTLNIYTANYFQIVFLLHVQKKEEKTNLGSGPFIRIRSPHHQFSLMPRFHLPLHPKNLLSFIFQNIPKSSIAVYHLDSHQYNDFQSPDEEGFIIRRIAVRALIIRIKVVY